MSEVACKAVLISEPQGATGEFQFDNGRPYLPYMWAVLKSYWERHGSSVQPVQWLEPIWWNTGPDRMLSPYRSQRIDLLGLSCYTWNWASQCLIAEIIKAENPECLVIAGGPEPDYKDPDFFVRHPYIDAVAVKDGEITFQKVLTNVCAGDDDLTHTPGLYLPSNENGAHLWTGPADVPMVFDHSPYVDQTGYYQRLLERHPDLSFDVILETNRGCPYSCSFCDWGSNTMSKVRRFDMERIRAEIDWLGRMRVGRVMLADANFGILPRDLEIADLLNDARRRYEGHPRYIFYSAAKNNPERATEIALKFAESGICTIHALSIQHTKSEVLAATNRQNISPDRQVQVVKAMMASEVPVEVQLILGIPGDTYNLWKGCLADLMEWGIHEDYLIQAYRLLPNAPAAEQAFLDRWQVGTIERITYDLTSRQTQPVNYEIVRKREKIVVSSTTYSRADWARMSTYSAFIKALHNSSLTQKIAIYLRLTHGVPYLDFYSSLVEEGLPASELTAGWHQTVSEHYHNYLADENASDHLQVVELPDLPYLLHPSRWIYVQACLHLEEFFAQLKSYLGLTYPRVDNLGSIVDYQHDLVILPSYDRTIGKALNTDLDWMAYFGLARTRDGSQPLGEPVPLGSRLVRATDQISGERRTDDGNAGYYGQPLDWDAIERDARWERWINRIVMGRSSAAMHNLQNFVTSDLVGAEQVPSYPS